jgi:hypothetical protein
MSTAKFAAKCMKCKNTCKMEPYIIVDKCADFVSKEKKEDK